MTPNENTQAERPEGWKAPPEGWRCVDDEAIPRNQGDCTHWMPLPAAPNALSQTSKEKQ